VVSFIFLLIKIERQRKKGERKADIRDGRNEDIGVEERVYSKEGVEAP
jgi:hypothetical protein